MPVQTPPLQVSPVVQLLKSSQAVPLGSGDGTQFELASQVPASQGPMPSKQVPPGITAWPVHCPLTMSQTPIWQPMSSALQSLGKPPLQTPLLQVLPSEHRSLGSMQDWPSSVGSGCGLHTPSAGSQTDSSQSPLGAKRQSLAWPTQFPLVQVPLTMHRSVGVQAAPLLAAIDEQVWLPSSQVTSSQGPAPMPQSLGGPPTQAPAWQVSPAVQNTPSSHSVPSTSATTTHSPTVPGWLPSLQMATLQSGVVISLQSCSHRLSPPWPPSPMPPSAMPPVPPPPPALVVLSSSSGGVSTVPPAQPARPTARIMEQEDASRRAFIGGAPWEGGAVTMDRCVTAAVLAPYPAL